MTRNVKKCGLCETGIGSFLQSVFSSGLDLDSYERAFRLNINDAVKGAGFVDVQVWHIKVVLKYCGNALSEDQVKELRKHENAICARIRLDDAKAPDLYTSSLVSKIARKSAAGLNQLGFGKTICAGDFTEGRGRYARKYRIFVVPLPKCKRKVRKGG